jgi:exoribonuclease-2
MFLEGQIIEFLEADQLKPGFVRKQERDRLQVIDPRGRHLSVNGDRVVIVHCSVRENDFPKTAKTILERVQARQSEVDIALLWESIGSSGREFQPLELAELFFSESTPEATSAVFHALSQDSVYFKRNGLHFVPKTADQVATEQTRRTRQRFHEEQRDRLTEAIKRLVRERGEIGPELAPVIDRIQSWMRYRTGDDVEGILEQIAGPAHARDAAYDILARAGRLPLNADRFLVIAGIEESFGPAQIEAAALLPPPVHTSQRADFRDLPAISIDDEDTLEVDDALTIREEENQYVVGIHIADVSSFVSRGDVLDIEALKRASTIYLPTRAVRMLPERLSTDLASLKETVDRPAFTVEVRFDANFNRLEHRIVLSSIHVRERLTYGEVDDRIDAADRGLTALYRIALRLREERESHGAINFRRREIKVRVQQTESGDDIRISSVDGNSASRVLVSEMMVLLNRLGADFAATNTLPVIFRTQEPREPIPADTTLPDVLAFEKLRRTFKRSRLSLTPGLHSGLGLSAYTQVSSPIRRYSDLVTQRQFTALLQSNPIPHTREELLQVLAAAEGAELEIRLLEERSTTYWLLKYLAREKIGAALNATVLDRKGTVELDDYSLRGRLPDPGTAEPGNTVQVTIDEIDPLRAEIRFRRA